MPTEEKHIVGIEAFGRELMTLIRDTEKVTCQEMVSTLEFMKFKLMFGLHEDRAITNLMEGLFGKDED